jgi:hypothetical protein
MTEILVAALLAATLLCGWRGWALILRHSSGDATFSIFFNILWVMFLIAAVCKCERRKNEPER